MGIENPHNYPVVNVKATLHFGSYHDVDSNENAFRMAASMAFKDGLHLTAAAECTTINDAAAP